MMRSEKHWSPRLIEENRPFAAIGSGVIAGEGGPFPARATGTPIHKQTYQCARSQALFLPPWKKNA